MATKKTPTATTTGGETVSASENMAKAASAEKAVAAEATTEIETKKPAAKAVGKTTQKPSETVKEKTTPAPAAKAEAAPKKKAASKAETTASQEEVAAPAPKAEAKAAKEAKPVKVPKTTATGKVPYQPDFTHSVLDAPKEEAPASVPTLRYSDAELVEFKTLIQRKLDAAKKELNYLQGLITRKDAMGGDNDDGRYMTMEDGSLSMEREQLSQMASRQITFIDHLEKALMRIENKTYGICRVTGKLIDKARLRAVPHATLSMEAKTSKTRM